MKRFKSIVAAALVVLGTALYAVPALPAAAVSSSSLSINPKKNYVIEPGKSVKDTLVINNLDTTNDLDLTLRVIDFTYTGNGGTPKLMLDPNAPQTTWSLKPFLTVPEEVVIPANGSKTLNMSISVPANQGAGSYYSAILYGSGSGAGSNVSLSASGVTLVFVTVPGKVTENLTLKQLGAYFPSTQDTNGGSYSFITTQKPRNIGYTLKNAGNVTESPAGSISLKYMFGKKQVINNINPVGSLALIGQTRTFTACIKLQSQTVDFNGSQSQSNSCVAPSLWPGHYTVTLDAFYGQNGNNTQELTGTASFWYLPWWFIISALVLILVVAFVVWRTVHKIRNYLYGDARSRRSLNRR